MLIIVCFEGETMTASTICAIIPTYNRSGYLRECIESVLAILPPVDQVIVVNDGSTDDTERIVQNYKDRVTYIFKENGGKAAALNVALSKCTADYVWICDDDDLALPDGLSRLKAALDADGAADFALGKYLAFQEEDPSRKLFDPQASPSSKDPSIKIRLLEEMFISLNALLARRAAYAKAGPFREDLIRSQDYDMALRLSRRAKAIELPENIVFLERKHTGVRGSSADSFSMASQLKKWQEYDVKIFSKIRADYSLEEFAPAFSLSWDKPLARRAAFVQRAAVFVKRSMWREAMEDLQQASHPGSGPATSEELKLLEGAGLSYLPWDILYNNPEWIAGLRACYAMNKSGQSLVLALCRPILWQTIEQLEKRNIRHGVQRLKLLVRLLGLTGAARRAWVSFFGR
jgi:glycosyltransferase involved in cell wall biosynthesis